MNIGVFDSGIGGQAIADTLARDFPDATISYVHDREHMPYGSRSEEDIIHLTEAAIQPLLKDGCDCIVLACNTATAAAIDYLRSTYPHQPFVGLEPMVKPAAEATRSGTIAVFATPYTLSSNRYQNLKAQYASHRTVLEPDCSQWAAMIEHNTIDDHSIARVIDEVLVRGADVIVLACTHYHWIEDRIIQLVDGRAKVIDPSDAISSRVANLLGVVL